MTLWHGRFGGGPSEELLAFTVSLPFDRNLASDDLAGSRAHVRGLARVGIIADEEATVILAALDQVEEELRSETFAFAAGDEDIHTAVERRVTEIAGAVGAKLHTGRSRNDQVATDLRLYCKRELFELAGRVHALARDVDRLLETRSRLDVSPLGAGALAGSSLPLDPDGVATDLGFARRFENSLDAVSDRDFVAEVLFDVALLGVHLSRIGEEVALWSTEEFGFLTIDDAYATGSSMLPQKKNPDIAELARGKTGRLIGHLTAVLTTLKGLPLSYNRDLQEDKEPLFDAVQQTALALAALGGLIATARFHTDRMEAAADAPGAAAVDLAEFLVSNGMPFREAHVLVGGLVRDSIERGVPMVELVHAHPALGSEAAGLLEPGVAVTKRTTPGGAGPKPVAEQLSRFRAHLEVEEERIGNLMRHG
jgi:argininosuccinate lyase